MCSYDSTSKKINSFNIKFDSSIVFDTGDSETVIDEFIRKYELDTGLIPDVQTETRSVKTDDEIATALLSRSPYSGKNIPEDALSEIVYTIRTRVIKDDFILESTSEWPLIEYENGSIKSEYLQNGILRDEYTFHGATDELMPHSSPFNPGYGLSSCHYYQQVMGPDGKPMKNNACVMFSTGLEDKEEYKYIGFLNFSVAASGQVSRLTEDTINLPDINMQALVENPYRDLNSLNNVQWQKPQKI